MPANIFTPRQLLTYLAVIGLIVLGDPQLPTFLAGVSLALIGVAIRIWGCGHLRKNKDLITTGPYAHVKHPLYLGTFLISCGAILAAGSPTMPALLIWAVIAPAFLLSFFGFYLPKKKRIEGGRMATRFGDLYPEYDRAVPDFVPSLRRYDSEPKRRWNWGSFRQNNELEMDLLIVALFSLVLFMPAVV